MASGLGEAQSKQVDLSSLFSIENGKCIVAALYGVSYLPTNINLDDCHALLDHCEEMFTREMLQNDANCTFPVIGSPLNRLIDHCISNIYSTPIDVQNCLEMLRDFDQRGLLPFAGRLLAFVAQHLREILTYPQAKHELGLLPKQVLLQLLIHPQYK